MSDYIGDFALAENIDFKFTTRRFTTGVPFTLAGTPALAVYANNTTTPIAGGVTLSVDFNGVTGLNHVRIVETSGNGYAVANNYSVVISSGTVDGVSVVGEVVKEFSVENRSLEQHVGTIITELTNILARIPAALVGGRMDSSVGAIATGAITAASIAADAITDAKVASDVTIASVTGAVGSVTGAVGSVTGAVGSVTGNVGGNVAGTVGSVVGAVGSVTGLTAADVAAIKAKTDSLAFTVAGQVDSNIQYVNDVQVTGNGQTGTEWGPA